MAAQSFGLDPLATRTTGQVADVAQTLRRDVAAAQTHWARVRYGGCLNRRVRLCWRTNFSSKAPPPHVCAHAYMYRHTTCANVQTCTFVHKYTCVHRVIPIYLSIYLSICISIYPFIYLSIYLSIYPSIYLSIYLSVYKHCVCVALLMLL